jgi:hypothetical protein
VDGATPEQIAVYAANYHSQKINQYMFEYWSEIFAKKLS